jgi:hypothetical protein
MEKIPADVAAWGEPKPEASREALSPKIRHANVRKTSKNRADIEVEQRGIMQSASETTEDCKRQAVKTVASQKHKKMTPTQSNHWISTRNLKNHTFQSLKEKTVEH